MEAKAFMACVIAALIMTDNCFEDTQINGIAFIAQTVDNLDFTVKFYTEILGGMLIPNFRGRNIQGDSHYYRMFQKEILDARNQGISPEQVGVPDIRQGGTYAVNWDFVLFDNCVMWFLHFVDSQGNTFRRYDTAAGTAKNGYGHLEFWAHNDVNPYQLLQAVYEKETAMNSPNRGISVVDDKNSFDERNAFFELRPDKSLPGAQFGIRFGNTRGPNGERIEFRFNQPAGDMAEFQRFCQIGAVHTAMLSSTDRISNRYKTNPIRMHGFHHVATTVKDTSVANEFYTSIIGGKLGPVLNGAQLPPDQRNIFLQDDILSANQFGRQANEDYGFVDVLLGSPNSGSVNFSFINMDNFYFDLYGFDTRNPNDAYLLDRSWSSPAYRNSMFAGFHVKESVPMADYIINMEQQAASRGWTSVKANRAVDVFRLGDRTRMRDYSRPMTSGGLRGFDYTFAKGPGGETFGLAKFTDQAAENLKASMLIYGSVSTAFPETNPYTYGGYDQICSRLVSTVAPTTRLTRPTTRLVPSGR